MRACASHPAADKRPNERPTLAVIRSPSPSIPDWLSEHPDFALLIACPTIVQLFCETIAAS